MAGSNTAGIRFQANKGEKMEENYRETEAVDADPKQPYRPRRLAMKPRSHHYLLPIASLLFGCNALAVETCSSGRALVSGFFSNNVHVYDACTGALQRLLDNEGRISGAQAIVLRPDGRLYVVSEGNGKILRYDSSSLAFLDTFIDTGPSFSPTGIAFGPDGDLYVAGFDADSVRRYDGQTGALKSTPVASLAGGLNGPDNGMTFGPDGRLYIPGYNSNNVLRYDPASGELVTLIAANSGGLRRTRAILFEPGNATLLVSSEGSNRILRFDASSGALINTFAEVNQPAGMTFSADGRLLVASNGSQVTIFDATGRLIGPLFPSNRSGGLSGATYVLTTSPQVDLDQVGSQYWILGAGPVQGRLIEVDMASTTGTRFGTDFDAAAVVRKRWGKVRIEFTSCQTANFSWTSGGPQTAGFGDGAYPLQLLVGTVLTESCLQQGFAQVADSNYMNGAWYGGESRSGEGLLITVNAAGIAVVAMFTHQPRLY